MAKRLVVVQHIRVQFPVVTLLKMHPSLRRGVHLTFEDPACRLGSADKRRKDALVELTTDSQTLIETNISSDSKEILMTFDPAAMAHLTSLMTNLYNDPEGAVFREYVSNGIDAHTAAGVDTKVDVFLPSWDTPMFMVQDYGTGMSRDTLENVVSQYGLSTKSGDNSGIGGYGLGFKSALAITSQFTVSSVKDNMMTTAIIMSKENSAPIFKVVDHKKVDKPNGTIVSIPVKDPSLFNRKSAKFLVFLDDLVNMKNASKVDTRTNKTVVKVNVGDTAISVSDVLETTFRTPTHRAIDVAEGIIVLMGGIRYDVTFSELKSVLPNESYDKVSVLNYNVVVIDAPIGSLRLSPNREGVQFDKKTTSFLENALLNTINSFQEKVTDELLPEIKVMNYKSAYDCILGLGGIVRKMLPRDIMLDNGISILRGNNLEYLSILPSNLDIDWVDPEDFSKGLKDFKGALNRVHYNVESSPDIPIASDRLIVTGKPSLVSRHFDTYYASLPNDAPVRAFGTTYPLYVTEEAFDYVYLSYKAERALDRRYHSFNGARPIKRLSVPELEKLTGYKMEFIDGEVVRNTSLEISRKEREEYKALHGVTNTPKKGVTGYYVFDPKTRSASRKTMATILKEAGEDAQFGVISSSYYTLDRIFAGECIAEFAQHLEVGGPHGLEDYELTEFFSEFLETTYKGKTIVFIESTRNVSTLKNKLSKNNSTVEVINSANILANVDKYYAKAADSLPEEEASDYKFISTFCKRMGFEIEDIISNIEDQYILSCVENYNKFSSLLQELRAFLEQPYGISAEDSPNLVKTSSMQVTAPSTYYGGILPTKYPFLDLVARTSMRINQWGPSCLMITHEDVYHYINSVHSKEKGSAV